MTRHDQTAEALASNGANDVSVAPTRCDASGWAMGLGCKGSDGSIVCPSCDQVVEALPHDRIGRRVLVVKPHQVGSTSNVVGWVA